MIKFDEHKSTFDEIQGTIVKFNKNPINKCKLILIEGYKNEFIKKLQSRDYELDEKNKNVILTDSGVDKIEKLALQKNKTV